jgi:hemerythrin-like metal-binding protein
MSLGQFKLVWRDVYLCGNQVIDAQHHQLFELCNSLLTAIEKNQPKSEVEFLLDTLLTDLSHHFTTEEKILANTGIPISHAHQLMHSKLLARAEELVERYRRGTLEMGDLFGFIAYDLAATHIAKEATMFVDPI